MADTQVTEEDIFDSAAPETPAAPEAPQETAQESADRLRDEQGRFAAKPEETPPAQEQPQAAEQGTPQTQHGVPTAAIQDERRKRQDAEGRASAYERQIAELNARFDRFLQGQNQPRPQPQEPQQAPDFFEDPGKFVDHRLQPVGQQMAAMNERWSKLMAVDKFGEETVNAAFAELQNRVNSNPAAAQADYIRVMQSAHPYAELVKWHKQQSALQKVGDDPEAYFNSRLEEFLKTPEGQQAIAAKLAPAGQQPAASNGRSAPLVNLNAIPSINRAPGSANTPASHAPASEEDIFNSA